MSSPLSQGPRPAYTLVEVVVSILLIAIVSSAIFSVALTSRQGTAQSGSRAVAELAARDLLDSLRNYVTADVSVLPGPGAAPNGWGLPGDRRVGYALAPGRHELDASRWLPRLAGSRQAGDISYSVSSIATRLGDQPSVTVTVSWREP